MSTTIRLTRMGRKKRPFYRLVVLDSRKRRDGAYLANLGFYNPFTDPREVELHGDDIISWLQKGATVSETAKSLLRDEGILYKYSLIKEGVSEGDIEAKMADWTANVEKRHQNRIDAKARKVAEAEAEAKAAEEAAAEAEAKAKAEEEAQAKAEAEAKAAEEAAEAKAAEEAAAHEAESDAGEGEAAEDASENEKKDEE